MDECINASGNKRFAGRVPVGTSHPITVTKEGQFHVRRYVSGEEITVLACGLACSEIVSGPNLANVIKAGLEYEKRTVELLEQGLPAPPLSIHTSAGVPDALSDFIQELSKHLPWRDTDDWCVTLQMEGASSVLAAIDLMIQQRHLGADRRYYNGDLSSWKVAVGATSYHGPPSTSPGANTPLFKQKHNQITYPVPTPFMTKSERSHYIDVFREWLETNGDKIGCLLVEPQWGSTAAGYPWDANLLVQVIDLSHEKGIFVIADEIMCGLGRHGLGTMFLSQAWGLDVDAVTFGKAIAAGVYPLSGAICRNGATLLGANGRSVLQSHTYSGGNVRSLMTATAVLRLLPTLLPTVDRTSEHLKSVMEEFACKSQGLFLVQGMGLMWGALINPDHSRINHNSTTIKSVLTTFKIECEKNLVLPYFVPIGGFMVTPLFDTDESVFCIIGQRLNNALASTMCKLEFVNDQSLS